MNNFDNILQLARDGKRDELVHLAITQGLPKPHPRAKPQTIAQQIIDHVTTPARAQPEHMKHPAEKAQPAPLKINTEAEVREVCAPYFNKEGFQAIFRDDDTWHFRYKGAEDSGHMSVPLRVLKMKAMSVAQGAHRLVTMKFDGEEVMRAG